jgi:glucose/arabinose dehydrogenase
MPNVNAGPDLIPGYNPNGPQSLSSYILATQVGPLFSQPLFAGAPLGDTSRLFIVERLGTIKIVDLASGQVLATPFLDVSNEVPFNDGERGLLGLAFDPDFVHNGFFYVNVSNKNNGNTEIRRYHVDPSNPNVADPASATLILSINQSEFNNHKGGWLGFGPDGDLYISVGDGGGAGNPLNEAGHPLHTGQDIDSLRGKILRIDVDSPPDPGLNYHIPADNPFVGQAGARGEIFALGLRNPWRPSFDQATGTFYIADVGQDTWEEIDIGQNGANYGWNHFEGPALYPGPPNPTDPISTGPVVAPIYSYNHNGTNASITGGYVYRGNGDALQGQYFFADFVQGTVSTLRLDGSTWVATDRTSQIVYNGARLVHPSSFGEDANGNLYVVDFNGAVFKLTPVVGSAPPPAGTTADMILRRGADGMYEIYNLGNSAILAAFQLGQVGTEWQFVEHRPFYGSDSGDMLLRSSTTGGFELYDISNNQITGAAFLGAVGMEWQVMGFGDFSSRGESDMILRNSNTGGLQVYDISNNQFTGTAFMGTVGLSWQFSGVGNFSSRGTSDMLLRNSNTGDLEVYDINSNQITGAALIGTIGLDWQFSGVGNFSGVPGESDLLLRNVNTGGLEVYNIANNQLTGATFLGTVGLDWQFASVAPIHAAGASDLVLRNVNTGAFEVYDIANNQIAGAAALGAVGVDWQLGGFAADRPAGSMGNVDSNSQLVQAMAGFGGGSSAGEGLNTAPLAADTSQQPLLTTPQHA